MLSDKDREKLSGFSHVEEREIGVKLYHALFEEQAAAYPDRTALVACDGSFTYSQLDKECNRLANALIEKGMQKGDRVAFLLPRTSRQIIAMYAVLKTGAAYIPCDPEYPDERIKYILENSEAKYILTDKKRGFDDELDIEQLLTNGNTEKPQVDISPEDTAYLIYTSAEERRKRLCFGNHRVLRYVA